MSTMTEEDRKYVIGRLDRDHIRSIAKAVLLQLGMGNAVEVCYQPGDATWYSLVFARTRLVGAPGGGAGDSLPSSYIGTGRVFVAYCQRGTLTDFAANDDPEWVAGKLTDNQASALAIAELLREIMQGPS